MSSQSDDDTRTPTRARAGDASRPRLAARTGFRETRDASMSSRVLATPSGVSLAFSARVSSSASRSRAPLALVDGGVTVDRRVAAFPRARAATVLLEGARSTPRRASARLVRRLAPPRAASLAPGDTPSSDVDAVDPNLRALVLVACLSMLAFGAATGAIAGALLFLERGTSLGHLTVAAKSAVVAATPLGALVGAATLAPRVARARGRRFALLLADGLYLVAALAMATAHTHRQLTFGRALAGVAVGVSTSLSALYISECAPRARGAASRRSRRSREPRAYSSAISPAWHFATSPADGDSCSRCAPSPRRRSWRSVDTSWNRRDGSPNAVERPDARRALAALGQPDRTPRRSSERPTWPPWHLPIGAYCGVRNIVARRRRRWA